MQNDPLRSVVAFHLAQADTPLVTLARGVGICWLRLGGLMSSVTERIVIDGAAVDDLRASFRGELVGPEDAGYDECRKVWNGSIDRSPGLIARCAGAEDVVTALRFARAHDVLISVRGGGHNVTGNAVCDGGLMIDLSPMKAAHVDPPLRTITAEPGLTWKDFDTATLRHGLATTGGIISSTGVAGLTLGGGHG